MDFYTVKSLARENKFHNEGIKISSLWNFYFMSMWFFYCFRAVFPGGFDFYDKMTDSGDPESVCVTSLPDLILKLRREKRDDFIVRNYTGFIVV